MTKINKYMENYCENECIENRSYWGKQAEFGFGSVFVSKSELVLIFEVLFVCTSTNGSNTDISI